MAFDFRILKTPAEVESVCHLQRLVWPGDEAEIVPVHMLLSAAHNGGILIGAYQGDLLVGFVFGFPGFEITQEGVQPYHASHLAGVHPDFRDAGLGFRLKRAQWQVARHQGLDRIIWTYDPLQSRNAYLNITKLGAVCSTYYPDFYGPMGDELNIGVPSDRFQVDWWLNTHRVQRRLGKQPPRKLDLAHYLDAGTPFANTTRLNPDGLVVPLGAPEPAINAALLLLEIPADVQSIRSKDLALAVEWSHHVREKFMGLFSKGYLVTDFVYLPGAQPRSFYVLSDGSATF